MTGTPPTGRCATDLRTLIRKPSGYLPIAMSAVALSTVIVHVAVFGIVRQADEGTAAHVFQLLMAAQALIIGFFVLKWVPRHPKPALQVLALQMTAAIVPLALIYVLEF